MKKYYIRSALFNLCFLAATAVSCVIYLPTLLLPRRLYLNTVSAYLHTIQFFERYVLSLTYEVRGLEHLPKNGPYLIASKHQSLFETFKLRLIFDDPAIILKKELLRIPVWGMYLGKSDVIAIDRSTPERALKSIEEDALRMKEQGRPIVIFPQGTRVRLEETPQDKPYKAGIARVQEATNLPVIPMALNSGYFWPKRSWLKRPGKVIFQLLEPIDAGKMERKELMNLLEKKIEKESQRLVNEAQTQEENRKRRPRPTKLWAGAAVLTLAIGYSTLWFTIADQAKKNYLTFMQGMAPERTIQPPQISGFPGPVNLYVASEYLQSNEGTLKVTDFRAKGWPVPLLPFKITTGPIEVSTFKWKEPLDFDGLDARMKMLGKVLNIYESTLRRETFEGSVTGNIDFKQKPAPKFDLIVSLKNHESLMMHLAKTGTIDKRAALFISAGLSSIKKDGLVTVPITQKNRRLYAGPLPVAFLPESAPKAPDNPPDPDQ